MIIDELRNIHSFVKYNSGPNGGPARRLFTAFRNIHGFHNILGFLRESQWRSIEWHRDYQRKKLQRIIKFSVEKVPYYRDLVSSPDRKLKQLEVPEFLDRFPVITEAQLRENFNRFTSDRAGNEEYIYMALSRKYSDSFHIPVDPDTYLIDKAMLARHYENAGFRIGSPILCFVNDICGSRDDQFRHDKASNRYFFSSNNLDRKSLPHYCRKIKEFNVGFMFGYPSALEIFADYLLEWEIEMRFQGIITSGEVLTERARSRIENAFNAKVYDLYHYSIPILGMGQCQYCDGYHLFSEYCYLELLDFNGNRIDKKGKIGRLVVTNTSNHAFPVIRFDTGDLGIYDGSSCDCGRGLPRTVKTVTGSQKDLLVAGDGAYILPGALQELFSEAGYPAYRYQLVQEKRRKFRLKLVRGPESGADEFDRIKIKLMKRLGDGSELTVEPVNRIGGDGTKVKSIVREYDPEEK